MEGQEVMAWSSAPMLTTSPPFATAATPDVLGAIAKPEVHLAVWQRCRPRALDWIGALDWAGIDDIDARICTCADNGEIAQLLVGAGYPQEATWLAAEIGTLARRFAKIVDDPRLRFRLEVVETDACRNFHSDQVLARLLVTLHGRGTQWIVAGEDGSEPHEMSVGDVAIFKGRLWTDELAIQHRSPPIAGSGSTRLLLVLNPLQKASRPSVLFDAGDVGQADLPALG